jgi:hypothetical protein
MLMPPSAQRTQHQPAGSRHVDIVILPALALPAPNLLDERQLVEFGNAS